MKAQLYKSLATYRRMQQLSRATGNDIPPPYARYTMYKHSSPSFLALVCLVCASTVLGQCSLPHLPGAVGPTADGCGVATAILDKRAEGMNVSYDLGFSVLTMSRFRHLPRIRARG